MRKITLIIFACLCTIGNIQANDLRNNKYVFKNWNRFLISYSLSQFGNEESVSELNGFNFGYSRDFLMCRHIPLAFETGAGLEYRYCKEDLLIYDTKTNASLNIISFYIPFHLKYNIRISDKCSISPYLGMSTRFNIYGYINASLENEEYENITVRLNIFNKSSKILTPSSRLQTSAKIGTIFDIYNFSMGLSYSRDLSYFNSGIKVSNINFSLGLRF